MIFGWKLDDGWNVLITLPFLLMVISFATAVVFWENYHAIGVLFSGFWLANLIVLLVNLVILGAIHLWRTPDSD